MNAAKQAAWLFFVMIILACSGWYFASTDEVVKLDPLTLAQTPDYIIKNLAVRQFNSEGQLVNYLSTPEMISIPNDNTHWLKQPSIILNQEGQTPWKITSEKAQSINRGEKITFLKQVIIHQDKGKHNQESTFKSEALIYFPKKKYATTEKAITFEQAGSVIHAIGMNANLATKHVQLLNKTQASFEPNHG